MLVLFANLKAGFSPSEPGGAGVVSIWIPGKHFLASDFQHWEWDFQTLRMGFSNTENGIFNTENRIFNTENEPFPKKLSTQKQTKRRKMDLGGGHADLWEQLGLAASLGLVQVGEGCKMESGTRKMEDGTRKMEVDTREMGVGSCKKASTLSASSWSLVRKPREGFERGCLLLLGWGSHDPPRRPLWGFFQGKVEEIHRWLHFPYFA